MSLNTKIKNIFSFCLRIGLSGLLLWYVFSKIDIDNTLEVLKTTDPFFVTLAFCIFVFINGLILWRWMIFMKALNLSVGFWNALRHFGVGLFGNLFLPSAIGGDVLKTVGLCTNHDQKTKVVASVLLDRLSGFASIVIVAVCAFIFGYRFIQDVTLLIAISIIALVAGSIALVLFNEKIYSFGCKLFNYFPKFKNKLMEMHYDIALLKNNRAQGFKALGLACINQVIFGFSWYLVAKALHQDIPIIYFLIFVPLLCVASSFPSIGGLGVRETGAAYLLGKIGVDSGIAVSISLINYFFMIAIGIIGGIIYVTTLSPGRVQHHLSNDTSAPGQS